MNFGIFGAGRRKSVGALLLAVACAGSWLGPDAAASDASGGHAHFRAAAGFDVSLLGASPENTVAFVVPVGLLAEPSRSASVVHAARISLTAQEQLSVPDRTLCVHRSSSTKRCSS
jgi:hypothetical protein